MNEVVFTNAHLILEDTELVGTLIVREGRIADMQPGQAVVGRDCGGAYLLPGLVELHTDTLEHCLMPRPGVRWPQEAALLWHDRNLSGAGMTTVCAAVALREVPGRPLDPSAIAALITALDGGHRAATCRRERRRKREPSIFFLRITPHRACYRRRSNWPRFRDGHCLPPFAQ